MTTQIQTHSALLTLRDERDGLADGYRFLDEKRVVLAAAMVAELERYEQVRGELEAALTHARESLQRAVERHGLEGLQVYPPLLMAEARVDVSRRSVLDLPLHDFAFEVGESVTREALYRSPEAEQCRNAFQALLEPAARLAGISGNLERLSAEYRITARRARALEDVLLPEIEAAIANVDQALEELDREEAIRVQGAVRSSLDRTDERYS